MYESAVFASAAAVSPSPEGQLDPCLSLDVIDAQELAAIGPGRLHVDLRCFDRFRYHL